MVLSLLPLARIGIELIWWVVYCTFAAGRVPRDEKYVSMVEHGEVIASRMA